MGTIATQGNAEGAFDRTEIATAADHLGVLVWTTSVGRQIRVATVGPDAPAGPVVAPPPVAPKPPPPVITVPVTKPRPSLTASGLARRVGSRVRIKIKGELVLPGGIADAKGCNGTVKVSVKRGRTVIASKTVAVKNSCAFTFSAPVPRAKVNRARKLAIRIRFNGNAALAPVTKLGSISVKR